MERARQDICHHVRNGFLVIRALCEQARKGRLKTGEAFDKIEHRCREVESALDAIHWDEAMRPEYIIIHHSLTQDRRTVSWGAIRRYHKGDLGWRDIGYHFGVELVDDHYEILMGRFPNEEGAHCKQQSMNRHSVGVCCVGNFDVMPPPVEQYELCLKLTRYLMMLFAITPERVLGHRELAEHKTCPGKMWNMDHFRGLL